MPSPPSPWGSWQGRGHTQKLSRLRSLKISERQDPDSQGHVPRRQRSQSPSWRTGGLSHRPARPGVDEACWGHRQALPRHGGLASLVLVYSHPSEGEVSRLAVLSPQIPDPQPTDRQRPRLGIPRWLMPLRPRCQEGGGRAPAPAQASQWRGLAGGRRHPQDRADLHHPARPRPGQPGGPEGGQARQGPSRGSEQFRPQDAPSTGPWNPNPAPGVPSAGWPTSQGWLKPGGRRLARAEGRVPRIPGLEGSPQGPLEPAGPLPTRAKFRSSERPSAPGWSRLASTLPSQGPGCGAGSHHRALRTQREKGSNTDQQL